MNYYVITPAKNEEKYIASTLDAMIHQTLKPLKWIIVDDGSTDRTIEIIEAYRKEHPWIEVVSMDTKQEKKLYGSKVIRAFNRGYQLIADTAYGFIVKLDADLSFPPNYFEAISTAFEKDKQLGICSGYVVYTEKEVAERMKRNTYVPGPIKSVRLPANWWFCRSQRLGWTRSVTCPVLRLEGGEYSGNCNSFTPGNYRIPIAKLFLQQWHCSLPGRE